MQILKPNSIDSDLVVKGGGDTQESGFLASIPDDAEARWRTESQGKKDGKQFNIGDESDSYDNGKIMQDAREL